MRLPWTSSQDPSPAISPADRAFRVTLALSAGALCGAVVWAGFADSPAGVSDWDQCWIAGRALLRGEDPYQALTPNRSPWPLYYPLPAVLLALPFAGLPLPIARAVWFAVSSGALAYAWSAERWRLVGLASGAFWWAMMGAQWTPLLLAGLWVPAFGIAYAAKPTTGLALWVRRPSWLPVAAGLVLLALSFVVVPSWPWEWREAVGRAHHGPLLFRPGGFLLLLALLRWRRPEARMLALLAVIPSGAMPYDLLLLFAVAETRREWLAVVLLTWGVALYGWQVGAGVQDAAFAERVWPAEILLGYLPAVAMVLRRPNLAAPGAVPETA